MNRRTFVKAISATASLAQLKSNYLFAIDAGISRAEKTPAEVVTSRNKWLLRNGLVQKQLSWSEGELRGQLAVATERVAAEGHLSDIAISTSSGRLPAGGFRFVSEKHASNGDMANLELHFAGQSGIDLTLRYVCRRGDSAIEQSCEVRNASAKPIGELPHFNPMLLALSMTGQVTACWIEGLHDDSTRAVEPFRTYLVRTRDLPESDAIDLQSDRWSSNEKLPALVVSSGGLSYFAGLDWSGEWQMTAVREGSQVTMEARLADFSYTLAPGESLVSPTAFYGVIRGTADQAWNSIHTHCRIALMPRVADDFPWVTYNTWYGFGPDLEEHRLKAEADRAADLGIEVFYLDDGWFVGSEAHDAWGAGAGTWKENSKKFPSGLGKFGDYVHGRGMKFGLWVEPERVDSRFVDYPGGVQRSWLATRESELVSIGFDGAHGSTPSYQVCMGSPDAVQWAVKTMNQVVRDYHVDWLKWDHNMYQPCTDWRHGHQAGDGNRAHIQGVYEIMSSLLKEFPDLIIENCASGGHRFDYGIMRFSRVTWTSDATQPAHLVRSHVFGASHAFPAQYLTTFYVKSSQDLDSIQKEPAQLDSLFRSRMLGAFGVCDVLSEWSPPLEASGRRSIGLYKRLRRFLRGEQAWLTPQPTLYWPAMALPKEWDAMQYWLPETDESVIYAFRSASPANQITLHPEFLTPSRLYEVSDEDGRVKAQRLSGERIIRDGVSAVGGGHNTSAILYIRRA